MRALFSLIVVGLLLGISTVVFAHTENDPFRAEMIVDGGNTETDVGDVLVWDEDGILHVKFDPVDPLPWPWYSMTLTHLEVATSLSDIPQKNGNPIPGDFTWSEAKGNNADLDGDGTPDLGYYKIPLVGLGVDTKLYIAAHAEVCFEYPDVASIISALPATVEMGIGVLNSSDVYIEVIVDGGILTGTYSGYCLDLDRGISVSSTYIASVLTNDVPNMDLIKYIMNQDYLGQGYTPGDIQGAIWILMGYEIPQIQMGNFYPNPPPDPVKSAEIVADAQANGVDFEPECGGYLALKLDPIEGEGEEELQRILIRFPLECGCDTAWGSLLEPEHDGLIPPWDPNEPDPHDGRVDKYGYDFPGKNWAHYFTYRVQSSPPSAPPKMSLDSSVTTTWGSIKDR